MSKWKSGFAQLGMCQCMGDFRRTKDCPLCGRKPAGKASEKNNDTN